MRSSGRSKSARLRLGSRNNWLLFSATVEATLAPERHSWVAMRIDYAVQQHKQWYKGGGMFGDGRSIPRGMLPGEGRGTLFPELIFGVGRELSGRMAG